MTDNLRRSHRTSITDTETYFHLENKRLITRNIIISVWALEETLQTDQQRNFNFLQPRSKRLSQTLSRILQRRNPPSWYSVSEVKNQLDFRLGEQLHKNGYIIKPASSTRKANLWKMEHIYKGKHM